MFNWIRKTWNRFRIWFLIAIGVIGRMRIDTSTKIRIYEIHIKPRDKRPVVWRLNRLSTNGTMLSGIVEPKDGNFAWKAKTLMFEIFVTKDFPVELLMRPAPDKAAVLFVEHQS